MILKIYKIKSEFNNADFHDGNHYYLKNDDNDKDGVFGRTLKSVISNYKKTNNSWSLDCALDWPLDWPLEFLIKHNFELIDYREYNSINELEFDYLEELI